jgi:hypothetical protein
MAIRLWSSDNMLNAHMNNNRDLIGRTNSYEIGSMVLKDLQLDKEERCYFAELYLVYSYPIHRFYQEVR